jgi:hypothetical protein
VPLSDAAVVPLLCVCNQGCGTVHARWTIAAELARPTDVSKVLRGALSGLESGLAAVRLVPPTTLRP